MGIEGPLLKLEVSLQQLESNFLFLKSRLGVEDFFCPMVKTNAYGMGDVSIAVELARIGALRVGVAKESEAFHLRSAGVQTELLIFGALDPKAVEDLVEQQVLLVVNDYASLEALARVSQARGEICSFHLKLDTGMHRLGFLEKDWLDLSSRIAAYPTLKLTGICTHLYCGEDVGVPGGESEKQILALLRAKDVFSAVSDPQGVILHVFNSSGLLNLSLRQERKKLLSRSVKSVSFGARPGLSVYGVLPALEETIDRDRFPLKPIFSLKTQLVAIKKLKPGDRLSYGNRFRADKNMTVGVLPIGYGDGFLRVFSGKVSLLCKAELAPVVGTVCMDYLMIDLTAIIARGHQPVVGDEVVIFGKQGRREQRVEDLSDAIGTIPYEIMTRISERVDRIYLSPAVESAPFSGGGK